MDSKGGVRSFALIDGLGCKLVFGQIDISKGVSFESTTKCEHM